MKKEKLIEFAIKAVDKEIDDHKRQIENLERYKSHITSESFTQIKLWLTNLYCPSRVGLCSETDEKEYCPQGCTECWERFFDDINEALED